MKTNIIQMCFDYDGETRSLDLTARIVFQISRIPKLVAALQPIPPSASKSYVSIDAYPYAKVLFNKVHRGGMDSPFETNDFCESCVITAAEEEVGFQYYPGLDMTICRREYTYYIQHGILP